MPHYPIFLSLEGRRCLVVGGGPVAGRKVAGLRRAGARVAVVARRADPTLHALADAGAIELREREYRAADLEHMSLAIAATDHRPTNESVAADARARGVLVNVVDDPPLCDFIAPAVLERGDLLVAVSTSGAAPAFASRVRDRIAQSLGPEYADALEILRRVRDRLRAAPLDGEDRRAILVALASSDLPDLARRRDVVGVDRLLAEIVDPTVTLAEIGVTLGEVAP